LRFTELSDGARVSTNEAIFILTTNAASRRIAEIAEQPGLSAEEQGRLAKAALSDAQFAPEILSRVDEVFAFRPLRGLDIARVVALEIESLTMQFGLKIAGGGIDPRILMDAIESLSGKMQGGVRDMTRAIERQVTDGLIEARQSGASEIRLVKSGQQVKVEASGLASDDSAARPVASASV
jgi:ATP-dependent Clp protease ATP-binding subunit ClpA